MTAKLRSEVFRPDEQAIVHTMNRCVRKCFLLGKDRKSGKNFGYRRDMFERELRKNASGFAIDLLSYAIMDNHFHFILRSRPDVVKAWSNSQVVEQWHKLCPLFRDANRKPKAKPDADEVAKIAADLEQVATWRSRLSDISWFMKLVSQKMAKWCNAEDGINGHFWQGRFKAVRLLDEKALLACSMYVELNRIEAELAGSLEESDYTSVQRRIQAFVIRTSMRGMIADQFAHNQSKPSIVNSVVLGDEDEPTTIPEAVATAQANQATQADQADNSSLAALQELPDALLSPIQIDEQHDPIGPHLSQSESRCSDKGFLPMSQEKYIELLRWTADQIRHKPSGKKLDDCPSTLVDLELEPEVWCKLATEFTDLFYAVAGMPESVDAQRSCATGKRFNMPHKTREMLSA